MSELKSITVRIQLNDYISNPVAHFKVDENVEINDEMVGHVMVQLAAMVMAATIGDDEECDESCNCGATSDGPVE